MSGGATAPAIADELRGPGIQFSATVVPDNVQTCAMYRFLAKRLGIAMNGVALFVESNTAFGDFFKRFQCPPEPDVPGPPLLLPRIIYLGDLSPVFAAATRALAHGGVFAFTVEAGEAASGYDLLPTLHYTHSEVYLRELAQAHGLRVTRCVRAPLREGRGEAIAGLAIHLQR